MIAALYAALARRRREWYATRPHLRRRLRHPVISIGNIATGGRGKTPFTAAVARLLLELGERPAVLSRGYARTDPVDGVVVVRDADGMRADVPRAGDEPFMLARQLPGAIVAVAPDRYLAGRLAEQQLGATVHLLDDGFQHFSLDRDIDIVLVAREDLSAAAARPLGRLREPADVLIAADAFISLDGVELDYPEVPVFRAERTSGDAIFDPPAAFDSRRIFALAGIARPEPFLATLRAHGWTIAGSRIVGDHHPFSAAELASLFQAARRAGAEAILTTEKDLVRLLRYRPFALPIGWLPLTMEPEPRAEFRRWLAASMASTRDIVSV